MRRRGGGGGGGGVERKGNAYHCAQQTFYRKPFVNEQDALSFPFLSPPLPRQQCLLLFNPCPHTSPAPFLARLNEKINDCYMYAC